MTENMQVDLVQSCTAVFVRYCLRLYGVIKMINAVREWSIQLAGIIIFSSVCEMIMPGGTVKKYVNIVMGIVLILAIMQPVNKLLGFDADGFESEINRYSAYSSHLNMDELQREQIIKLYCKNLSSDMEENIREITDKKNIKARVEVNSETAERFGEISYVYIDGEIKSREERDGILRILKERYGVDKKKVRFG